jgi:Putative regulator of cell autolysis
MMKKQQSINGKILSILFITFMPVLVVLGIITWIMFLNMYNQILDVNRNEMKLFVNQFDNDVATATDDMKGLASNYMTKLYALNDPGVIYYNFWRYLDDVRANRSVIDMVFVQNGKNIDISYKNNVFQREEIPIFQKTFLENDFSTWKNFSYHMISIDNRNFIVLYSYVQNYKYGYLIDMDQLMKRFQNIDKKVTINYFSQQEPNASDSRILSVISKTTGFYLIRNISNASLNRAIPIGRRVSILFVFLCLMLFPVQWISLKRYVVLPLGKISDAMKRLEQDNLDYQMDGKGATEEFTQIEQGFNHMVEQIKNLKIESYENDIERLRIENLNLRLQVNPHMLLNSLNMIYSLAKSHNEQGVEDMCMCLSKYFRYVLYNDREFSKIKDEIGFILSYMEIQKIRFPGAFSFVYDVDDALFDEEIPTMLIQNFVENSIKYALNMETEIDIMVLVKEKDEKLSISIIDTGNGIEEEILEKLQADGVYEDYRGTHIGIWNCKKRLKLHYGDGIEFSISSKRGEGTQVWMEIPRVGRREQDESSNG